MKNLLLLILLLFLFSCNEDKKSESVNKVDKKTLKDNFCFREEERAKNDIENGNLNFIIWLPLSTNYEKAEEVRRRLSIENIKIEFYSNSCNLSKGIQNCYEVFMNNEFERANGKKTVERIFEEFEKFEIRTLKIEKRSLENLLYKKTAYNSR